MTARGHGAATARAVFAAFFLAAVFAMSCAKEQKAGSFDDVLGGIMRAKSFDDKKAYLTDGTVELIDEAVERGVLGRESRSGVIPLFDSRTRWDEVSRSQKDGEGSLRIRYTAHPVENMIGAEVTLKLVRNRGGWKVDLEKELKDSLAVKGGGKEYLDGIRKKY